MSFVPIRIIETFEASMNKDIDSVIQTVSISSLQSSLQPFFQFSFQSSLQDSL